MVKLSSCQNDPTMGESFWQKDSLTTYILFELWLIMIFSPPERKLTKHTSVHLSILLHRLKVFKTKLKEAPCYYYVEDTLDPQAILLYSSQL